MSNRQNLNQRENFAIDNEWKSFQGIPSNSSPHLWPTTWILQDRSDRPVELTEKLGGRPDTSICGTTPGLFGFCGRFGVKFDLPVGHPMHGRQSECLLQEFGNIESVISTFYSVRAAESANGPWGSRDLGLPPVYQL